MTALSVGRDSGYQIVQKRRRAKKSTPSASQAHSTSRRMERMCSFSWSIHQPLPESETKAGNVESTFHNLFWTYFGNDSNYDYDEWCDVLIVVDS